MRNFLESLQGEKLPETVIYSGTFFGKQESEIRKSGSTVIPVSIDDVMMASKVRAAALTSAPAPTPQAK